MNKTAKIWLIIALVFTVVGGILFVGAMVKSDWNFKNLTTDKLVAKTFETKGDFNKISINVDTTDIEFLPTDDEICSIAFMETEKVKHNAVVQNGTLIIDIIDTRKWHDRIGIYFENPKMTVYLPKDSYSSLFIENDTGDINIPKDFTFENIKIDGDTSDLHCYASVLKDIDVELSTGSINLDTIRAEKIKLATDTGDITFKNVMAESFYIESDTGNVKFKESDADEIFVKTSTGDVTGTLLSKKVFIANTSTGNIYVPKSISGGRCEITTSTGNIKIDVKT